MKRKIAILAILVVSLLLAKLTFTLNIQPINAEPGGNFLAYVIFADYSPVEGALIKVFDPPDLEDPIALGFTNATGYCEMTLSLSGNEWYSAYAYYPDTSTYFGDALFLTDGDGNGNTTITGSYEITPPVITILSPQNKSYTTSSIPLTFIYDDYSEHSWYGYSLDNNPNVTISGNTTISVGLGQHNVIVYANDTYGNMGSSDRVYFSRTYGCVTITVLFSDNCPVEGAWVVAINVSNGAMNYLGYTNKTGQVNDCTDWWTEGSFYHTEVYYPDQITLFGSAYFFYENGSGSATIKGSYEITPPVIEIMSPQNMTYTNSSVPLIFTVYDYSSISWIGYSLDDQPNVTITGNTTLTDLALGSHNLVIYSNDTYGNMGSSNKVYFTKIGCVTIQVQYKDGYPRSDALVLWSNATYPEGEIFGLTNENGTKTRCNYLDPGFYEVSAWYPDFVTPFGLSKTLEVNATGDGSATITADYPAPLVAVTVLFADGYPVEGAWVRAKNISTGAWFTFGYSNASGQVEDRSGWFTEGTYRAYAYYPDITTIFGTYTFDVDENGKGNATIIGSYKSPCVTVTVLFADSYPVKGAHVLVRNETHIYVFPRTNTDGQTKKCDVIPPGTYVAEAYYPAPPTLFSNGIITVDENGNGNKTLTGAYKSIEIHSPQNITYTTNSVPLNFTFHNSSVISWMGYSLDGQSNVTISGNTIITDLASGLHNMIVYGNDTNGYTGYSNKIYFTISTHDIAVTSVVPSKTVVGQGYSMNINVTVENQGGFAETFDLAVYADRNTGDVHIDIETRNVYLDIGESKLLEFVWDTTGVPYGSYWITAEALLPGDEDPADNIARTRVGGICVPHQKPEVNILALLLPTFSAILALIALAIAAIVFFKILTSPRLRWP